MRRASRQLAGPISQLKLEAHRPDRANVKGGVAFVPRFAFARVDVSEWRVRMAVHDFSAVSSGQKYRVHAIY